MPQGPFFAVSLLSTGLDSVLPPLALALCSPLSLVVNTEASRGSFLHLSLLLLASVFTINDSSPFLGLHRALPGLYHYSTDKSCGSCSSYAEGWVSSCWLFHSSPSMLFYIGKVGEGWCKSSVQGEGWMEKELCSWES